MTLTTGLFSHLYVPIDAILFVFATKLKDSVGGKEKTVRQITRGGI